MKTTTIVTLGTLLLAAAGCAQALPPRFANQPASITAADIERQKQIETEWNANRGPSPEQRVRDQQLAQQQWQAGAQQEMQQQMETARLNAVAAESGMILADGIERMLYLGLRRGFR